MVGGRIVVDVVLIMEGDMATLEGGMATLEGGEGVVCLAGIPNW